MEILKHRALRGPNRYSRHPTMFMLLDIGKYEDSPSDDMPGFTERLIKLMPSLDTHRCSVGEPGGFIQRLHRGTWAGHIAEHIALELQCLAGMEVGFGKTFETDDRGIYRMVYRYRVESVGLRVGREAIRIFEAMAEGDGTYDMEGLIDELKELREDDILGPSTKSIVDEAERRGIPTRRLNTASFVQLGHGVKQRRIQATMTDRTSALGVEIADEKYWTKELLQEACIATSEGKLVRTLDYAMEVAEDIGYPVAVKPEIGNHGKGISAHVMGPEEMETAFNSARKIYRRVIIEKSLVGLDFRVLVIDGKLVAAAMREPAHVVGNGKATIGELITTANADPRRGVGHERSLTNITVNDMTERLLAIRGFTVDDVLPDQEKFYLKSTANLSTGGTARDVTDDVHPSVWRMCERVAAILAMDCVGIDIVAPSLDQPLDPNTAGIVEVNAAPGFRMHLDPTEGTPRNVAIPFVEMMFPSDQCFDVPIVAVTGTNGKTTTARLIAHTLKYCGKKVGFAGTTGVDIDGALVTTGDYSGPGGAAMVLRDPTVDHAVLEVARGGIIRRGLGFRECNVGLMLNVDEDHIGTDGVDTVEDLAMVKSTVLEVVKDDGVSVLNAEDPLVVALAERAGGQVVWFSLDPDNAVVKKHLAEGGTAVVLKDQDVVILSTHPEMHVMSVLDAPITLRGLVRFNIANVLAATAALHGLGISPHLIRTGINSFHSSATQNPGRMNLVDFMSFKVLLDYGHNVPAIKALGQALPHIASGKKIVVAHGTGNRTEKFIKQYGAAMADIYDTMLLADIDPRGRAAGETPLLVREGALSTGLADANFEILGDALSAIDRAFELVESNGLIVIQVDESVPMLERVMEHFQKMHQE